MSDIPEAVIFPGDAALTHLLVVAELDRSVAFYRDVLGAELVREYGARAPYSVVRERGCCSSPGEGRPPTSRR